MTGKWQGQRAGAGYRAGIFGAVFAAAGLGLLFFAVIPTLVEALAMRSWQPVSAEVSEAHLHQRHTDDGITYRVTGRYHYTWQGLEYSSTRIGISGGSDNIGDWHQRYYGMLSEARDGGFVISVWVDPQSPHQAIVDREIRWGLLAFYIVFAVIFGGVGAAVIVFSLHRLPNKSGSLIPR